MKRITRIWGYNMFDNWYTQSCANHMDVYVAQSSTVDNQAITSYFESYQSYLLIALIIGRQNIVNDLSFLCFSSIYCFIYHSNWWPRLLEASVRSWRVFGGSKTVSFTTFQWKDKNSLPSYLILCEWLTMVKIKGGPTGWVRVSAVRITSNYLINFVI